MTTVKVLPWGPHTWYGVHYVALGYPQEPCDTDKQNYRAFFENLGNVLPCKRCTAHYNANLARMPLTDEVMKNADSLFRWTVDLHNEVNKQTGKRTYSYEEANEILMTLGDQQQQQQQPSPIEPEKEEEKTESSNNLLLITILMLMFATIVLYFLIRGQMASK